MTQDTLLDGFIDPRTAQLFALLYGSPKPSIDSLPDHGALELGKGARHLKHELACRLRCVDRLLLEEEVDHWPRGPEWCRVDQSKSARDDRSPRPSRRQSGACWHP